MTKAPTNIGASAKTKLLRLSKERREDYQVLLARYANERLLHRLSVSPYAESFVLKGAALFTLWTGRAHRATRDIDLLGFGEPTVARLRAIFEEVIRLDVVDDGVRFDVASLDAGPIREDQDYGGVRLTLRAEIGSALVRLQVDVGFGDAITPGPELIEFPPLLGFDAPKMRAYPRPTVVAEKLEAIDCASTARRSARSRGVFGLRLAEELPLASSVAGAHVVVDDVDVFASVPVLRTMPSVISTATLAFSV